MKKDIFGKAILSSVLITALCACGSTSASSGSAGSESAEETAAAEPEETSPAAEESTVFAGKGTTSETVLVDEADIKITASEITYNEYAAKMDLTFENNTDKTLNFRCGNGMSSWNSTVTVNGYEFPDIDVYEDVKPGETKSEELYIQADDFNTLGITDVAVMEFRFTVTDKNSSEIYLATEPVRIETSSASSYDLTEDTYQKAVQDGRFAEANHAVVKEFVTGSYFSQNGVNIISSVIAENEGRTIIYFELENVTDEIKNIGWSQFGLNRLIIEKTEEKKVSLNPHSRAVVPVIIENMISREGLISLGITDFTSAFFQVRSIDNDGNPLSGQTPVTIPFGEEAISGQEGEEVYNSSNIRILSSGIEDSEQFFKVLLTVSNNSSETIMVSDSGKALLVNGLQNAQDNYCVTVAPGQTGVMKIGIRKTDSSIALDANGLTTDQIEIVETGVKVFREGENIYMDTPFETPDLVIHLK